MKRLFLPRYFLGLIVLIQLSTFAEEMVVVVNKNNEVDALTRSQVIDLFMGKYVAFPDGRKAQPLDNADAAKASFYKALVGLPLARVNAYWSRIKFTGRARPPLPASSTEEVITFVVANDDAIGYIPASKVNTQLKVVYSLK